ncbi:MAG: hypothetical protein U0805_08710 [Pirellulales bacterium]
MRATDGTMRIALVEGTHSARRTQFVATLTCAGLAVACFLLYRRTSGALTEPLPTAPLCWLAAFITLWAYTLRELSGRNPLITGLTLTTIVVFAVACSYPGARIIDWLAWPAAMFVTVLSPKILESLDDDELDWSDRKHHKPVTILVDDAEESEHVLQQVTRVRTAEGHEAIRGQLIAEFAAGERQTTLYASFCPPFEHLPHVDVNLANDFEATVKPTQVLHNGAQFDVRLAEPAEEAATVLIEFFATDAGTG